MLRVGTILKLDMVAHHVATMVLIGLAYSGNMLAFCVMWQALFDISNPLLHVAKTLNYISVPALETPKWLAFALFALTFFLARVIAGPVSILWPAFATGLRVLPPTLGYTCFALVAFVCGIQYLWFYKIVQVAVGGGSEAKRDKLTKVRAE